MRAIKSPAGPDVRAPELFAIADGRVIMSWVEKIAEKCHELRFVMCDAVGEGSEPRTVAEGDNWFVN